MRLAATEFGGPADAPLLLVGPSLGTSASSLWTQCAARLTDRFRVVGWDLPGHGGSPPASGFDVPALSAAVAALADQLGAEQFHYAGDSLGGAAGMQLLLDAPGRVVAATLLCTAARIVTPQAWTERAALVRAAGTAALLESAPERWFAPAFAGDPAPVLAALAATDDESYASACEALAGFDLRDRLAEIATPVLAIAGIYDLVVPVADMRRLATDVQHGRCVVLDDVAHLAPLEAPDRVAELIADLVAGAAAGTAQPRTAGMQVRREVLGDDHVDRAVQNTTAFTDDFQDLITRYAWGEIWTRPGLDRRSRSLITLTALVARGHDEEFAMHVRAALRNGVTVDEIRELLLQLAVYCGVPAANNAFKIAQRVIEEA